MSLGERIKNRRIELCLSQKDLAKYAEVTPGFINLIENNKRIPSITVLCLIADALTVSTDYLLCRTENKDVQWETQMPEEIKK